MKISMYAFLMAALLFLTAGGCSKHKNRDHVPEPVIVQFDQDHAEADDVYWEPSEKGFRAKFKDNGIEKIAIYSPKAKPLRLEFVVSEKEVPVVVMTNLQRKYPKVKIEHITYIEVPNRKPYYVVRTKDAKAIRNIEINLAGLVLRRVLVENLVVVRERDHIHDNCHGHHKKKKHKQKRGHAYGHDKHDKHEHDSKGPGIVIRL